MDNFKKQIHLVTCVLRLILETAWANNTTKFHTKKVSCWGSLEASFVKCLGAPMCVHIAECQNKHERNDLLFSLPSFNVHAIIC